MTDLRIGRLIDHLQLRVADLEASRRFYRACAAALGVPLAQDAADHFVIDELYVDEADGPASRVHLAFQAGDRAAVDRFHAPALAAGGRDNGAARRARLSPGLLRRLPARSRRQQRRGGVSRAGAAQRALDRYHAG